jgi:hypothetical protein
MLKWEDAQGAPMVCAVIVLLAIVALGGISVAFSGNVQF